MTKLEASNVIRSSRTKSSVRTELLDLPFRDALNGETARNGNNAKLGFLSISKAKTRCISHRVMPAPLFRGGKKRSFGLQISSVPDGTLIIARREMFEQSIKEPEGLSDPPSKRARQSQE